MRAARFAGGATGEELERCCCCCWPTGCPLTEPDPAGEKKASAAARFLLAVDVEGAPNVVGVGIPPTGPPESAVGNEPRRLDARSVKVLMRSGGVGRRAVSSCC